MSIRTKLFLILGISQIVLVTAITIAFLSILTKLRDDPIEKITLQLASSFERELFHKESKMQVMLDSLIQNSEYMNIIVKGLKDRDLYSKNIEKFQILMKQDGLSIFEIGDRFGKVVFRFHRPADFGDDKSGQKIIQEALRGKISSTLEAGKSGIGLRVTGPINNNQGTMLIGQVVNKEFLAEISGSNSLHLALYLENKLLAVSSDTIEEVLKETKSPLISKTFVNHKNSIFYVTKIPYEAKGLTNLKLEFLVLIDETELQNSTRKIWYLFIGFTILVLSGIFFISYLFSKDIINAVKLLAYSMKNFEIKDEGLLDTKRSDELGEMAKIYIDMKKDLLKFQNHLQELVTLKTNQLMETNKNLEVEKNKSDKLLLNILPTKVAEELKDSGYTKPIYYESVSVMFTDFVGFTHLAESMSPDSLVGQLDECFKIFDFIIASNKLEKLKTIGDGYMCAGGLPERNNTHGVDICLAAMEINDYMNYLHHEKLTKGEKIWEVRIGINSGPLVAGVVGNTKFAYDVWGDTVNLASRMESSGFNGKVNLSPTTYELVKDFFDFEFRGKVFAKRKGETDMYFLLNIKKELSEDGQGKKPNQKFWELYRKLENNII
ncbi:MAG: adenylate/guanylate cyclase domain-containing protein [Leptospiraceae bacterium]|nr:adenylate/guanylate cyclase domain-containing protein [Leptospiraceae bacterium]